MFLERFFYKNLFTVSFLILIKKSYSIGDRKMKQLSLTNSQYADTWEKESFLYKKKVFIKDCIVYCQKEKFLRLDVAVGLVRLNY